MKKLLMAVMLFCGVVSGFAQSKGEFRIGPTVGMNAAGITDLDGTEYRIGFNLGARVDYGFTNNVYIASGLILSQKGFDTENDADLDVDFTAKPLYLNIPIHIGYTYSLGNVVSIFGETGPYLGFGVGGRYTIGNEKYSRHPEFFGEHKANTFDMGWGLRIGVEANRFQIHLGYEYGITDTDLMKYSDVTLGSGHNSNISVGVSYMF